MRIWAIFAVYVLMSAAGLYMIKSGTTDAGLEVSGGVFSARVPLRLLLGFALYVCSFLLSVYVVSRIDLSVFYPVGTGSILVLACLSGRFLLGERVGTTQMIGIALVLAGVVFINFKR